jgi:hypothetical protein
MHLSTHENYAMRLCSHETSSALFFICPLIFIYIASKQKRREAGRQGGREAGRQGGREAGRQGGREAGRQGGREAGRQGLGGKRPGHSVGITVVVVLQTIRCVQTARGAALLGHGAAAGSQ